MAETARSRRIDIPSPRPTRHGVISAVLYLGLPLIGFLLLLDLALYLVFTRLLGRCYGILCLLG